MAWQTGILFLLPSCAFAREAAFLWAARFPSAPRLDSQRMDRRAEQGLLREIPIMGPEGTEGTCLGPCGP